MSGFAVVYERSNTPVDPGVLERVMNRMPHRGPDGRDEFLDDHVAMGHWHFWTTPEEVGERQPSSLPGLPFRIVFDGRLDNRPDLINGLQLDREAGRSLSDAALVLHAYDRWGEDCFTHLIGEFALAILDEAREGLVFARDALGERSLFYAFRGSYLVVASEPWAVAIVDGEKAGLNENAVAYFFVFKAPEDGGTLFKDIYELLPGQVMLVDASHQRTWRYWRPDLSRRMHRRSDREFAEGFLPLLEESVRCRLRSKTPAAILMSGGLDSTSVASLAARMIAPDTLTTLSYVFDELPQCDERAYIDEVKTFWRIHSIQYPCDDLWPYKDLQAWPRNPNQPERNLYRLIMERTYESAGQAGIRVLLTGHYGDQLYDGEEDWLADLVADGRLRDSLQDLRLHLRYAGLQRTWKSAYVRRAMKRIIQVLPGGRQLLDPILRRRWKAPAWLAPSFATRLSGEMARVDPALRLKENLLGQFAADGCAAETFYTNHYGIELRYPYRDRRLIEYVLALPAYQLYLHGQYKYILRNAMQGLLPEAIRMRTGPTNLLTLLSRGMEYGKIYLQRCVEDTDAAWRKYVRADWLMQHWGIPITPENSGSDSLVPWLCLSFSSWLGIFNNNSDN